MIKHIAIRRSLLKLIKNDRYLLEHRVHERAQTHKLGEYLQYYLPEWNVDCEYNKKLDAFKELDFSNLVNAVKSAMQELNNTTDLRSYLNQLNPEESGIADENGVMQYLLLKNPNAPDKRYIKKVMPDVIAHLRGTKKNKIVIEAKLDKPKKEDKWFDLIKLGLFTEKGGQYNYKIGYFITLPEEIPIDFDIHIDKCSQLNRVVPNHNVYEIVIK